MSLLNQYFNLNYEEFTMLECNEKDTLLTNSKYRITGAEINDHSRITGSRITGAELPANIQEIINRSFTEMLFSSFSRSFSYFNSLAGVTYDEDS